MVFLTTTFCGITCRLELCFLLPSDLYYYASLRKTNNKQNSFIRSLIKLKNAKCQGQQFALSSYDNVKLHVWGP